MRFILEVDSDSEALTGDDAVLELVRIVRDVADRLLRRERSGRCQDMNGYPAGYWSRSVVVGSEAGD